MMAEPPRDPRFADVTVTLATAPAPGAVAVITLLGGGATATLALLTGRSDWPLHRAQLVNFSDIDHGLAVMLGEDHAELMPHGGPRVVQRLVAWLCEHGARYEAEPDPWAVYPEAGCTLEAHALAALARTPSPAAVGLLLGQVAAWRRWLAHRDPPGRELLARRHSLDHLLDPPTVVVIGKPNVGKSTLTNALLGRGASIVADLPGTTRDWVAAMAELGPPETAVAVRWLDTPGLRVSDDPIESAAIAMAQAAIARADAILAIRAMGGDWPDELPVTPDLWVLSKVDAADLHGSGGSADDPLPISAATGWNLDTLAAAVLDRLGLASLPQDMPWAFCEPLREALERDDAEAIAGLVAERRSEEGRPQVNTDGHR